MTAQREQRPVVGGAVRNDYGLRLRHPNRIGQRPSVALSCAGLDPQTQLVAVRKSTGKTPAQMAATQSDPWWLWRTFSRGHR